MAGINPTVLIWARESAGLDRTAAAEKLGLSKQRRSSGEEVLRTLEEGTRLPTSALLTKMSQVYRRPLISFYVDKPPQRGDRGQDFRTLPIERRQEDGPTIDAILRDVRARQSVVRAVLDDDAEQPKLNFVGAASLDWSITRCAGEIAAAIQFDRRVYRQGNAGSAFSYLRNRVEQAGIFVLLIGNLGTNHTNISPEIFRGFALADDYAPFIVVNDQDSKAAWSFTILHELVHLWLGQTGISGGPPETKIEKYCNDVASEILLAEDEIVSRKFDSVDTIVKFAGEVAHQTNVSRSLVIYRLFKIGAIDPTTWKNLSEQFRQEWLDHREREKQAAKDKKKGKSTGPSYYVVRRHKLGTALVELVRRSMDEGLLTPTKAGQVLGVKPMNVRPLLNEKAA